MIDPTSSAGHSPIMQPEIAGESADHASSHHGHLVALMLEVEKLAESMVHVPVEVAKKTYGFVDYLRNMRVTQIAGRATFCIGTTIGAGVTCALGWKRTLETAYGTNVGPVMVLVAAIAGGTFAAVANFLAARYDYGIQRELAEGKHERQQLKQQIDRVIHHHLPNIYRIIRHHIGKQHEINKEMGKTSHPSQ